MATPKSIELRRLSLRSQVERRTLSSAASSLQIREAAGGLKNLSGHAAVFGQRSEPLGYGGWFVETIRAGAFAKHIKNVEIKALWNHDTSLVLASTSNGSLVVVEDEIGLKVDIDPNESTWGQNARIVVGRGDVNKMSIGFNVLDDAWRTIRIGGVDIEEREVLEAEVVEVSPVPFPAYPQTDISSRAFAGFDARELLHAHLRCLNGVATKEDRALVRDTARMLSDAASEGEHKPAAETESRSESPNLDSLRRRLDLMARTIVL